MRHFQPRYRDGFRNCVTLLLDQFAFRPTCIALLRSYTEFHPHVGK